VKRPKQRGQGEVIISNYDVGCFVVVPYGKELRVAAYFVAEESRNPQKREQGKVKPRLTPKGTATKQTLP
jgi:hypothetical protein